MDKRTRRERPRKQYRQRKPTPLGPAQVRLASTRGNRPVVVLAADGEDQWAITPLTSQRPATPYYPVTQFVNRVKGNSYLTRNDIETVPAGTLGSHVQYVSDGFLRIVLAACGDALTSGQREALWVAGGGTRESLPPPLQPTQPTR